MLDPAVTERKKVLTIFHCIGMRAPKSSGKWSDIGEGFYSPSSVLPTQD